LGTASVILNKEEPDQKVDNDIAEKKSPEVEGKNDLNQKFKSIDAMKDVNNMKPEFYQIICVDDGENTHFFPFSTERFYQLSKIYRCCAAGRSEKEVLDNISTQKWGNL
jgi:hypothetical protein